jgi:hypothetical protein
MKLVPKHITELKRELEQIKIDKNKVVRAQKYEEAAKLRDLEKPIEMELATAEEEWNNYMAEKGITEFDRLCLRFRNGVLEVLIEQSNGTLILHDGSQKFENELYVFKESKWLKIINELQKLINKPDLKEQELQDFFEEYPDLIMDEQYEFPIPQAAIVNTDEIEWRADFVMVPVDQLSFAKILELKLPGQPISKRTNSGHYRYSAKLFEAINQLKDYYEAFNSEKTQEKFKNRYNTEVFKPDLQLLFGRRSTINNSKEFLELQRRNNVEIKDWDTLAEQLKKKFK